MCAIDVWMCAIIESKLVGFCIYRPQMTSRFQSLISVNEYCLCALLSEHSLSLLYLLNIKSIVFHFSFFPRRFNQSVVQKFETYILHNQLISSWPVTCLCQACNFKILVSNWRVWQRHLDHRLRTQCLEYSLRWRGYLWWRDNKSLTLTSCGLTDGVGLLCSTLKQFADWELPPKVRLASFLHSSFSWNQLSKD